MPKFSFLCWFTIQIKMQKLKVIVEIVVNNRSRVDIEVEGHRRQRDTSMVEWGFNGGLIVDIRYCKEIEISTIWIDGRRFDG